MSSKKILKKDEIQNQLTFTGIVQFDIVVSVLGMVPGIIHYLWCGNRWFGFKQYLALDSAVKAIKPDKVRRGRGP